VLVYAKNQAEANKLLLDAIRPIVHGLRTGDGGYERLI
jgi:hypothetical protein